MNLSTHKSQVYDSDKSILNLIHYDFVLALKESEGWLTMSWTELSARYGRTLLGIGWNMLSFGLFCLAIILLFGSLQVEPGREFGPYVVTGFLIFSLITNIITDAASVFITNENWIRGVRLPYGFYIYKGLTRNLIIFSFNAFAAMGILLVYYDISWDRTQLSIVLAVLIYLINGIFVNMLLGVICARYRDMVYLVQTIVRFSLFVTPIMWNVGGDTVRSTIAKFNPLTHFIEIVRLPLIRGTIPADSWIVVGCITIGLCFCSLFVYGMSRRRLIYWL